jgi:hypothetical protein
MDNSIEQAYLGMLEQKFGTERPLTIEESLKSVLNLSEAASYADVRLDFMEKNADRVGQPAITYGKGSPNKNTVVLGIDTYALKAVTGVILMSYNEYALSVVSLDKDSMKLLKRFV